jgi:hypothetical protein
LGKVVKLEARSRRSPKVRTRLQSRPAPTGVQEASPLTPELKAFIDAAIVPVLVKRYLALVDRENELAERDSDTTHSVGSTSESILREVRP